jgi:hypothetical protein
MILRVRCGGMTVHSVQEGEELGAGNWFGNHVFRLTINGLDILF